jgi:RNA polymerase sigma-70 factor (ECF subfamily)
VNRHDRIVEHIPRLRRYARALMRGDTLAADDLVQDCLERALSRLHRWRSGSDLRAWLLTIMHNLYIDQLRKATNGPNFVSLPDDEPADSARAGAESAAVLDELQQALNGLSPDQREIILLVSLEGMRYQEVATILGVPEGTVMSRLYRAREKLRKALSHEHDPRLRRVK